MGTALLRLGRFFTFSTLIFLAVSDNATLHLCEGFLPPNDMKIPVGHEMYRLNADAITQASFDRLLNQMQQHFKPTVSQYGGNLVIEHLWSDATVNAFAKRQGNNYIVSIMGGLARHAEMTLDGLALVVCHEIGHHIGGAPKYSGAGNTWASTEGQSDYYANLKCLREYFASEPNFDFENAPATVVQKCQNSFKESDDVAVCVRSSMAGLSGSSLFWALKGGGPKPNFDAPDPSVVTTTYESHPAYQCRLDTYFAGSTCTADLATPIGQSDYRTGTCDRSPAKEEGGRPRCWFAPPGGSPNPNPNPNPNPGQSASTPTINGMSRVVVNNPNIQIPIAISSANIAGAAGVLLEISKPNQVFSNPNGDRPDPVGGLGYESARGTQHVYRLLPARQLPGWGVYQVRVLALDQQGRAVGRFSNAAVIELRP